MAINFTAIKLRIIFQLKKIGERAADPSSTVLLLNIYHIAQTIKLILQTLVECVDTTTERAYHLIIAPWEEQSLDAII